jgi:hypothetical protein
MELFKELKSFAESGMLIPTDVTKTKIEERYQNPAVTAVWKVPTPIYFRLQQMSRSVIKKILPKQDNRRRVIIEDTRPSPKAWNMETLSNRRHYDQQYWYMRLHSLTEPIGYPSSVLIKMNPLQRKAHHGFMDKAVERNRNLCAPPLHVFTDLRC